MRRLGLPDGVRACLFDLDGVLTRTAVVHAAAWKQMFDDFLRQRAGDGFRPFDAVTDDQPEPPRSGTQQTDCRSLTWPDGIFGKRSHNLGGVTGRAPHYHHSIDLADEELSVHSGGGTS
jgi:hypothetical protein